MKQKFAILYICTGNYVIFWKDFFKSAEKYLLTEEEIEKHYFVFTDANIIDCDENTRVHRIYQEPLSWPYITLDRFSIFQKAKKEFAKMDYIYFFNANMRFVKKIGKEILPSEGTTLALTKHPGFFNKIRDKFTYETNPSSLAYVSEKEGDYYFMGGLSGGFSEDYIKLIDELKRRIDLDKEKGIIALWHDESHLNRYAIDYSEKIKILDPSFGYPEGWKLPFEPKIIIRDKKKVGGHDYLRGIKKEERKKLKFKDFIRKFLSN